MKVRHQKVEIWTSQKPKKKIIWKREWIPAPAATKKEKEDGNQRLEKALELLTACSNQTMNDECQHFGNMIAAKLMNYNERVRYVIQNEIMNVFLNANRGLYERYHHTHLQPINPPQAHFPRGPYKLYSQNISPPPHISLSSLCSQNPSPSCSRNTSTSPISQYNNSILPHSFPTESISPATTSSEGVCRIIWYLFLTEVFL